MEHQVPPKRGELGDCSLSTHINLRLKIAESSWSTSPTAKNLLPRPIDTHVASLTRFRVLVAFEESGAYSEGVENCAPYPPSFKGEPCRGLAEVFGGVEAL